MTRPDMARLKGRTVVVKIGGEVIGDPRALRALCADVAACADAGIRLVLVHGGGKQASEVSRWLGIAPRLVNGRRITDDGALEVVKMVYAGTLNVELLAALRAAGARAVGLSGVDAGLVRATRRSPVRLVNHATGREEIVDFGHVGDVERVDRGIVDTLHTAGIVPVIASLAADAAGNILNVNADTLAARVAGAVGAARLVLVSNVDGILDRDGRVIERADRDTIESMIEAGIVTGGMIAKAREALAALQDGVGCVQILGGLTPLALVHALSDLTGAGTVVVGRSERPAAALPTTTAS